MKKLIILAMVVLLAGCTATPEQTVEPEVAVTPETVEETEVNNGPYEDSVLNTIDVDKLIGLKSNPDCPVDLTDEECKVQKGLDMVSGVPEGITVEDKGVIDGYHHLTFTNEHESIEIGIIDQVYDLEMTDWSKVWLSDDSDIGLSIYFYYSDNILQAPEGKYDAVEAIDRMGGPIFSKKTYYVINDDSWAIRNREVIAEDEGYLLIKEEEWFDGDQTGIDYLKNLDMVRLLKVERFD